MKKQLISVILVLTIFCTGLCTVAMAETNDMGALYQRLQNCYEEKDYGLAYDTAEAILAVVPNYEDVLCIAIDSACQLGLTDGALEYIERLAFLAPERKNQIQAFAASSEEIVNQENYKKLMSITIVVNGGPLTLDVPPVSINDRTMIPLRAAFEALDAQVTWDEHFNTAKCVYDKTTLEIKVDSNTAKLNGAEVKMDVAAVMIEDRVLVPIRFVAEKLKFSVKWDEKNSIVTINKAPVAGKLTLNAARPMLEYCETVLTVSPKNANPYNLKDDSGIIFVIVQDKKALDTFNILNDGDRLKYLKEKYAGVQSELSFCTEVILRYVYDGRVYLQQTYNKGTSKKIERFLNGDPQNIVMQMPYENSCKDFYLLPKNEQFDAYSTSSILFEEGPKDYIYFSGNTAVQNLHLAARISFEKDFLPRAIGTNNSKWKGLFEKPDEFKAEIYKVWTAAIQEPVKKYIKSVTKSDDPYLLTTVNVEQTINETGLAPEKAFDIKIKSYEKGQYIVLIDMKNIDKTNTSSYIAIASRKDYNLEYYMLGKKSNNKYRMVMYMADKQPNTKNVLTFSAEYYDYGEMNGDLDSFINTILKAVSEKRVMEIKKTTSFNF